MTEHTFLIDAGQYRCSCGHTFDPAPFVALTNAFGAHKVAVEHARLWPVNA